VADLGQVVVGVVELTGDRVGVGEIARREVVQSEVDSLSRLGDQLYGTRRHAGKVTAGLASR